ncbi:MAG: EscU/YscU/HrcU family type III secretion system export apparatus switch protein [Bacteroidota bacterium]|nr:EscU/YscU/HrcU family type III secretion system export apparatus switch protein [Bacteroidota bacterium]MDP4190172.1 EscU/YscU/HrcU family type III secretion system export apparatus switch protein [Bacteroidota bacterium]MDP4193771.1 EscU/YscU/HrcU family type III secretion system export apparatus switch protein [Bacteroidota bacterium]
MSRSKSLNGKGAIALGYNIEKDNAPKILAKGSGELAERIIAIAKENKILIKDDPLLFDSLYSLEVGEEIPVRLFQVIAELLAFVYRVNGKKKKGII